MRVESGNKKERGGGGRLNLSPGGDVGEGRFHSEVLQFQPNCSFDEHFRQALRVGIGELQNDYKPAERILD